MSHACLICKCGQQTRQIRKEKKLNDYMGCVYSRALSPLSCVCGQDKENLLILFVGTPREEGPKDGVFGRGSRMMDARTERFRHVAS